MKKSRFTDSQIAEALKRVEAGLSVPELCRDLGISSATTLQVAGEVRRRGHVHDGQAERAGVRKRPVKEDLRRRASEG